MERQELKRILEGFLFVSEKTLGVDEIREVLEEGSPSEIREALVELKLDYAAGERGFRLEEVAGGFRFATDSSIAPWLKKLYRARQKVSLSKPALETLAIVAYRQPITRTEIEAIRGVNVDGVVKTLLERGLIRITGRKEVLGRPILYGTSREFLEHFGMKGLEDLPPLSEFTEKDLTPEELASRLPEEKLEAVEPASQETNLSEGTHEGTVENTKTD